jgi:hypothetical protein
MGFGKADSSHAPGPRQTTVDVYHAKGGLPNGTFLPSSPLPTGCAGNKGLGSDEPALYIFGP